MANRNKIVNKRHEAHSSIVHRQTRIVQNIFIGVIVLVIGIVTFGILGSTVLVPYRDVATVNGEAIKASDFQKRIKLERTQLISQYTNYMQIAQVFGVDPSQDPNFAPILQEIIGKLTNTEVIGKSVLDTMIAERLIVQEANKMGITVSDEEIEARISQEYGYFAEGAPTVTPTATAPAIPTLGATQQALIAVPPTATSIITATATLDPSLTPEATLEPTATFTPSPTFTPEPTATPFTYQAYQDSLKLTLDSLATQVGLTEQEYKQIFAYILYREKLREKITVDVKPFEEQVWVQHILVNSEEEANAVLERLKTEDWATLALELSLDTGSSSNAGDLGWFGRGVMIPPFEEAAFALTNPGDVSVPIATQYGFHILRLVDRGERALNAKQFDDAKTRVFNEYLINLRDSSDITTYDDFWKSIVPTEPALQ